MSLNIPQDGDAAPSFTFTVDADPGAADVAVLERGLHAYEEARLGSPEHRHFGVFMRDDLGRVLGGIDGHVMWRRLFIKTMWVAEPMRGQGYGTGLLRAAELEAMNRSCRSIWLTALGDLACRFYLRLDYKVIGVLEDYVSSQSLYTLHKTLG